MHTHATIHRHDYHSHGEYIDTYTLKPGEGILFYKHRLPEQGQDHEIFRKAEHAFKHGLAEIFAVLQADLGLLLAPSLDPKHATTAYFDYNTLQHRPQASLEHQYKKIKYKAEVHK